MMGSKTGTSYEWRVVKVKEESLEDALNELEASWDIFSVTPTVHFGGKFMGTAIPNEVLYTVVVRRENGSAAEE